MSSQLPPPLQLLLLLSLLLLAASFGIVLVVVVVVVGVSVASQEAAEGISVTHEARTGVVAVGSGFARWSAELVSS